MQTSLLMVLIGATGGFLLLRVIVRLRGAGATAGLAEVSANEAADLIAQKRAVVVDVRTAAEYSAGRIPKARHVPLGQLPDRIGSLKKYSDRPIVVSCRTGRRSASACAYLSQNGFEEVYNLKGGIRAWVRAKRRIES